MSGDDRPDGTRAPWWREVATLLGVLGLFVTLVFNTLGVWQGAQHNKDARDTEQIALLTQLDSSATDTERAINATSTPERQCVSFKDRKPLSDHADADLRAALDYYEYLAWLFNQGRLTVTHSRLFFSDRMVDGWRLAGRYLGQDELSHVYSELTRFVRETPRKDLPPDACAYIG